MGLSKRTRFEVFKRDKFTCAYCGRRPPEVMLEVDHVHPKCDGGSDEMDNLVTSCEACNRGKAGKGLGDVAPAVDEATRLEAMQEMAERAALLKQQMEAAAEAREVEDECARSVVGAWIEAGGYVTKETLPDYLRSVRRFVLSLDMHSLHRAVDVASAWRRRTKYADEDDAWRYFCGVCWKQIREKEDR